MIRMPATKQDTRTPVTLLTGFLGSGKTTLLNRALNDPAMTRTAVIINEFGEIGIDHALTTASDDTIMVLENGCLCCTVFGDLVQTLNRLYHAREAGEVDFDHVVIETSGLAEAGPILQAFLSEPTLDGLFRLGAVVTTVDVVNGPGTLADYPVSVRQVALADSILLTKLDMLNPGEREEAMAAMVARLRRINANAPVLESDDPASDPVAVMRRLIANPKEDANAAKVWLESALGATNPHAHADAAGQHDTHGHEHAAGIASFTLVRDEPLPREALQLLLSSLEKHLGSNLLRVKGLVNVKEEPGQPAIIQGAQHLLHNLTWLPEWPDDDHRTRIVFITQDFPPGELEEMVTMLDRIAHRTAKARERAGGAQTAPPI